MGSIATRPPYPSYRAFRSIMSFDFATQDDCNNNNQTTKVENEIHEDGLVQFYVSTLVDLIGRLLEPVAQSADVQCLNVGAGFALCCALIECDRFNGRIDLAEWDENCVALLQNWKRNDAQRNSTINLTEMSNYVDNLRRCNEEESVRITMTDVRERIDRILVLGKEPFDGKRYDMIAIFLPRTIIVQEEELRGTLTNIVAMVKDGRFIMLCGKASHASEAKKIKLTLEQLGTEIYESYDYEFPLDEHKLSSVSETHFIFIVNCSNSAEYS